MPDDDATRSVDRNFAVNLRSTREEAGMSQEQLATAMTDRGFAFSQATIWKIEQLQRPVRIAEAEALVDAVMGLAVDASPEDRTFAGAWMWAFFAPPREFGLRETLRREHRNMEESKMQLEAWTRAFLAAQYNFTQAAAGVKMPPGPGDDKLPSNLIRQGLHELPAEYVVLAVRLEDEFFQDVAEAAGKRRRQLAKVWNRLVAGEKVPPSGGMSSVMASVAPEPRHKDV